MTQDLFPEIQAAVKALENQITVTESEIVKMKESISEKKKLVRGWRKAVAAVSPRAPWMDQRVRQVLCESARRIGVNRNACHRYKPRRCGAIRHAPDVGRVEPTKRATQMVPCFMGRRFCACVPKSISVQTSLRRKRPPQGWPRSLNLLVGGTRIVV